ncbi:MAG TPA: ribosomal L7Ae/L30e/S12e/Gadd45 family protein [Longimicrobiales bacterium]|nr:ribosomal L7Ae/L30e/S12e/Gadd45 family protein [Longimicrobiales bacterium]
MARPDRALALLGMAARAGAVVPGTERVREAARSGTLVFALVADDASDNSRGKLVPLLEARNIPFARQFARVELGAAIGRAPLSAVGVVDRPLADRLQSLLEGAAGQHR